MIEPMMRRAETTHRASPTVKRRSGGLVSGRPKCCCRRDGARIQSGRSGRRRPRTPFPSGAAWRCDRARRCRICRSRHGDERGVHRHVRWEREHARWITTSNPARVAELVAQLDGSSTDPSENETSRSHPSPSSRLPLGAALPRPTRAAFPPEWCAARTVRDCSSAPSGYPLASP